MPIEAEVPEPDEDLIEVFAAQQESEALVVQSLLNSAGLETLLTASDAPQDVLPGVGALVIRVRADQAEEARQMLKDYLSGGVGAATEGELESETSGSAEQP